MPDIDTDEIALWGTSFSGGHVMVTAAKDKNISAIVAQVPFVDAISSTRLMGWKYMMEATAHGLKDLARILSFKEPHYVKIAGTPDEFAVMNTTDAYEGVMSILPENTEWNNQCPARILLRAAAYRPTAFASKIQCPSLIQVALKDSLIDARAVVAAALKIPKAELMEYDIGHFDIYTGKMFEEAAAAQIRFLTRHLLQ
jgi:cephalosporin-C deacetylase-like acetyl esterase